MLLSTLGFVGLGGMKPVYRFFKNLPRDLQLIGVMKKMFSDVEKYTKANTTIPSLFREVVAKHPNKTAILFEDQKWTYRELDSYSNRVASVLLANGFKHGDCIALYMTNCPQYIGIFIGACKIGVEVALINCNLRDKGLLHCIAVSKCSGILYESRLEEAFGTVSDQLDEQLQTMCFCCLGEPALSIGRSFDSETQQQSDAPVPLSQEHSINDIAMYIYTSGTTGLPKAVAMRQKRVLMIVKMFKYSIPINEEDVVYCCLPLYHTSGLLLVMGQCFTNGTTVALRRKFSASNFFTDCIKYKCTAFCYIGELCRYILLQPPAVTDTQHSIVKCYGNGLRADIWKDFKKRFAIPKIVEFYGSTEGTIGHLNLVGKEGAIGYFSPWMRIFIKLNFVKVDSASGKVLRNEKGFCIKAGPDDKGEMIRELDQKISFDGYTSEGDTSKKILRNVFKTGDSYFSSGDIVRVDEDGFIYFCDRAGDTFRWKGENVSTTEVENTIGSIIGHADTVVYGVEVPKKDGRAGMAAIVGTAESVGVTELAGQLMKVMPSYSVPRFIRLVDSTRLTGTFKFQKVEYRKEGFDVDIVKDELYVLDADQKAYVLLTKDIFEGITNGVARL